MKKLIIVSTALTLITTSAHASWFGPSQEVLDLQNQVAQHLNASHFWSIVAGVLALVAIITFIAGTILGSRTRRNGKGTDPGE